MEITVKLYGIFAYELNRESIILSDISDIEKVVTYLKNYHPVFKETPFRVALNNKMIQDDVIFNHKDVLAVMPPFSGG